jgi:hypothetical protein
MYFNFISLVKPYWTRPVFNNVSYSSYIATKQQQKNCKLSKWCQKKKERKKTLIMVAPERDKEERGSRERRDDSKQREKKRRRRY